LALQAFGAGLPVPEATVRTAFVAAVRRAHLAIEHELSENASPGDVADAAVRSGLVGTMLPVRVRNIDQALLAFGLDDLPSEIRDLDPGPQRDAIEPTDWTFNTVLAMRAGGGELTVEQLGDMARSVMPPTLAAPYAAGLERQWPDNEVERALLLNESGGLSLFPDGDIREFLTAKTHHLTLTELRSGWEAAEQLSKWSSNLCATDEAELAAGELGPASLQWMIGAILGPGRMLLTTGLRDVGGGPSDLAFTGLLLLWMRDCIRTAHHLLPHGEFEHLREPGVIPPCFLPLLIDAQILEPSPVN
jgi:hypothetical protein